MQALAWAQPPTAWETKLVKCSGGKSKDCLGGGGGGEDATATYGHVVSLLPLEVGLVGREDDTDVQLSQSNLDASLAVRVNHGNVIIDARGLAGRGVRLHADAIDLDALVLQHLDDLDRGLALGADALQVVVVVVQLGLRVDLGGGAEGQLDVLLAEGAVEDGLAVGAVLLEGLIDDVPGVAAALPVPGDVGDVVDDDVRQLGLGPVAGLDPGSELRVPDEGVAAEDLVLLLGDGGDDLTLGPVEDALLGLGEEPLLACQFYSLVALMFSS